MQIERIMLDGIEVGERLRQAAPDRVSSLKASIAEIGLRTPVTVLAVRDGDDWLYRLVAGAHRLEALRQLGQESVEAFVMEGDEDDAALWEIDENFARAELTDAQRAEHHVRREAILVRRGEVHAGKGRPEKSAKLAVYADQASASLGVGKRTVERDLARGKKIAPEVLAEVSGTDLDKGVVLDELARTPAAQQPTRLAEIRARRDAHKVNREHDRVIALTEAEQFGQWLMARADLNELPTLISWLEGTKAKDVIAALRREAA
jgi:ParB-like chromosome segregation protein Spo0J